MSSSAPAVSTAAPEADLAALGMWVFLASEVLFFGVVLVAYAVSRLHAPAAFAAASAHTNYWLGTLNTAVLLTSSGLIAIGAQAAAFGRERDLRHCLRGAAALGVAFLAIKGMEYHEEWSQGLFPGPGFSIGGNERAGIELFFTWYFVVTSLHALHLSIGIVGCLLFARESTNAHIRVSPSRVHALGLYWHFVDIVWVVLYPLIYLVAPR
jgi:cytochrome c oxidase subunit III